MKKRQVIFLLLPKMHLLDLAGPDQVFLEAGDFGINLSVVYAGVEDEVTCSTGMKISGLQHFDTLLVEPGDFILIPGADIKQLISDKIRHEKQVLKWLVESYRNGAYISSVCTGAFFLGKSGLLDGRKCTTHWKHTEKLQAHFPLAKVENDILFTEDNRIFTSAGVAAGIDLALHIIQKLKDELTASKIARELVVHVRRKGHHSQQSIYTAYRDHIHAGIHDVQDFVQENIDRKISLTQLAAVACMSPRNLTRVFKKETGITVNNYINRVRKEVLINLKTNPDLTRKQMAALCGLASERQLSRLMSQMRN